MKTVSVWANGYKPETQAKPTCPICEAGLERRVAVVVSPGTPHERTVYIRESLYNRIKAVAAAGGTNPLGISARRIE